MPTSTTVAELNVLQEAFERNKKSAFKDYYTFLKFQSISSEPVYKEQVLACADWVADYLKPIGFEVEKWQTSGHPTIFANYNLAGPEQPTLLIYNHYDVQPVDPLELWKTPPFQPTLRNGQVFARGAQDNKGQCFYVLFALKTLMELYGKFPINIKLCIEGEEECGSAGLSGILAQKKSELKADYLAIVDLDFPKPNKPVVTLGIRGMVAMDVEITGSRTDLHSGSHGGLAYNPIHALTELLSKVRDSSGKITIPGFYDEVKAVSSEEKKHIRSNFDPDDYFATFGTKATGGEQDFSPLERNWIRPTFEINGINGGYSGAGFKTIIPAKASAKVSCRLVPNQEPQKIGKLVAEYLESHAPEGTKVKVHVHQGGGNAVRSNIHSKAVKAFADAYGEIFQVPCEYVYSGASIPIIAKLAATSGAEVAMVGLGLPDDGIHAPNEHFGLDRIENGFLSIARAIQLLKNG
ncbi:MAG: dipeptidase [Parachlamydiaceae bacterium]|nr:dipeptidase [Parachlamydiaceae bacterium]